MEERQNPFTRNQMREFSIEFGGVGAAVYTQTNARRASRAASTSQAIPGRDVQLLRRSFSTGARSHDSGAASRGARCLVTFIWRQAMPLFFGSIVILPELEPPYGKTVGRPHAQGSRVLAVLGIAKSLDAGEFFADGG